MKRTVILTIGTAIWGLSACSQKMDASKVPGAVKVAFTKQYPGTAVRWEKEGAKFEAGFKQNGNTLSALYDVNGILSETETDIKVAALPATVLNYIKEHYKGKMIKEAASIVKADGCVNYEAEVNGKDVIFDATGKFLKEVKD